MNDPHFTTDGRLSYTRSADDCWETDLASWTESVLLSDEFFSDQGFVLSKTLHFTDRNHAMPKEVIISSHCPSVEALSNPFERNDNDDSFRLLFQNEDGMVHLDQKPSTVVRDEDDFNWYSAPPSPEHSYDIGEFVLPPKSSPNLVYQKNFIETTIPKDEHPCSSDVPLDDQMMVDEEKEDDDDLYEEDDDDDSYDEEEEIEETEEGDDDSTVSHAEEDAIPPTLVYAWLVEALEDENNVLSFKLHAEGGAYMSVCAGEVIRCIESFLASDEELTFLVRRVDKSFVLAEAQKVVSVVASILQGHAWTKAEIIGEDTIDEDKYDDLSVVQDFSSRSLPHVVTPSTCVPRSPVGHEPRPSPSQGKAKFRIGWRSLTGRAKRRPLFPHIPAKQY
jgi:hypothetical protein